MDNSKLQSLATDQFFYFFLRLRKGEVRRTVQVLRSRYPDETPEQLARRLTEAKAQLTLVGGMLLSVPLLFPGIGQVLKLVGMVGSLSLLTRMHLYLILEIALVYGKDIDDQARVAEMASVVAASGLAAASPMLVPALNWQPLFALPIGALTTSGITRLIGESSIRYYGGKTVEAPETQPSLPTG
jgi:uncharacterized protein (DUF697 family)